MESLAKEEEKEDGEYLDLDFKECSDDSEYDAYYDEPVSHLPSREEE